MRVFSVHQAKARLSEVLRLVKATREVVITEHGRRIARIVPITADDDESLDERFAAFLARGQLEPAAEPPEAPWPSPPARRRGALRRFLEDRG